MPFSDDFTRADSLTVGNGWIEENPNAFEILGNKLRARGNGGGTYTSNQLFRPDAEAFANGTITVDFQMVGSISGGVPQVHGRCQGANYDTFYIAYFSGGTFYLGRVEAGALTSILSQAVSVSVGVNYQIELTMSGDQISAVLDNLDTATNLATLGPVTNGYIAGAGRQALSHNAGGTNDIDYDNFYTISADSSSSSSSSSNSSSSSSSNSISSSSSSSSSGSFSSSSSSSSSSSLSSSSSSSSSSSLSSSSSSSSPSAVISGVLKDRQGNTIDCSAYNIRINVYPIANTVTPPVATLLCTAANGAWSILSGLTLNQKYLVTFEFIGVYTPLGDLDIAGADVRMAL